MFTSLGYGKSQSSADVILEMTKKAMGDLNKKLKFLRGTGQDLGNLWTVRINSGKFGVKWHRTKRVLEQCGMDLTIVYPPQEDEEGQASAKNASETVPSSKKEEISTASLSDSGPSATAGTAEVGLGAKALTVAKDGSKKRKKRKSEVNHDEGSQKKKKAKAASKSEELDVIS